MLDTLCEYIQEFVDIVDKDVGILNNDAKAKIDKIKGILSEFKVTKDTSVAKLKIVFKKFRLASIGEVSANGKDVDEFYNNGAKSFDINGIDVVSDKVSYMMNNYRNYVEFTDRDYNQTIYSDNMEDFRLEINSDIDDLDGDFKIIRESIDREFNSLVGKDYNSTVSQFNKFINDRICYIGFKCFVIGVISGKIEDMKSRFKQFVKSISDANLTYGV